LEKKNHGKPIDSNAVIAIFGGVGGLKEEGPNTVNPIA
jgi:hypothetical protein